MIFFILDIGLERVPFIELLGKNSRTKRFRPLMRHSLRHQQISRIALCAHPISAVLLLVIYYWVYHFAFLPLTQLLAYDSFSVIILKEIGSCFIIICGISWKGAANLKLKIEHFKFALEIT